SQHYTRVRADRRRIAAHLIAGRHDRVEARPELRHVAPLLGEPAPDVGMPGGNLQHPRALGPEHDRDTAPPRARGSLLQVARRMERALEARMAAPEERHDDLD